MTISEFINAPIQDLAELVLDQTRWSKYDHGQQISEATLNEIADAVDLLAPDVLLGIQIRRERKQIVFKCNQLKSAS